MSFKSFFIFTSGGRFVQWSRTSLAILVEGHPKNISVKPFWNLAVGLRGDVFKGFSIFSSDGHFVQQSGTILATLVESHQRNISEKLFWNQAIGQGGNVL